MRDPDASVVFDDRHVTRKLRQSLPSGHFLCSETAERWVRDGRMTPYERVDDLTVAASRLDFVSYPTEWCDAQLHDAAAFTLQLARDLAAEHRELKDASAWNILFDGCVPQLCDLFSVEPMRTREWWALGQFSRHFVLPLALTRYLRLRAHQVFALWRDGVPTDAAAAMLGWRRFMPRYAALLLARHTTATPAPVAMDPEAVVRFRINLMEGLEWMLAGVSPKDERSTWADYEVDRAHYSTAGLELKRVTVRRWIELCAPQRMVDLGCNAGEFSMMGADARARVVAIDSDHGALQRLYRRSRPSRSIFPLLATLDDLRGDRGWAQAEQRGLMSRLERWGDMVLMLALVHHLAIASSIPLAEVASFLSRITCRWLVVEWIGQTDPQLQLLCNRHRRTVEAFGLPAQRSAFVNAGFVIREELSLPGCDRVLALLELNGTKGVVSC